MINGNMVGASMLTPKSLILEDENGNSFVGVTVGEEAIFTADPKTDIREGTIAATDQGVVTGEAIIPNYETSTGTKIIRANSQFQMTLTKHDTYDYTQLQCIICLYNSSMSNSVAAEWVVIGDNVYGVNSTTAIATTSKDSENKSINFNFTNTSDNIYVIRYFTYKELY